MKNKRNTKIDILRAFAMICIVIAHAKPNPIIFELRNFDVIMIVIIMGASFYLSSQNKKLNFVDYVIKRFKRLILPTWVFLTIFFIFFYIISLFTHHKYFSFFQIIESYKLLGGIGYVWIMKVFFLVALTSPFILRFSNKIKSDITYFILLSLIYALYYLLYLQLPNISPPINTYYNLILLEGLGYSIVTAIGIRLLSLNQKSFNILVVIITIILIINAIYYQFETTQLHKYPPLIYYISYGTLITFISYRLLDIKFIHDKLNNIFMHFISKHSLWLYFWHIIPIYLIQILDLRIFEYFSVRFIFIFIIALLITIIQNKLSKKIRHS